ncbi:MAG: hypothetical protein Q4D79_13640 [Propionibacteriaceae bacterium]|nr:hypothetical protein [Propionibacteriaceae bacterium]
MFSSRRLWSAFIAGALALSLCVGNASAEPPISDEDKAAESTGHEVDSGYASSLEEEAALEQETLPEEVSPGAYPSRGKLISRVYADESVPPGAQQSRFTQESLAALQTELTSLAGEEGKFFGFEYHPETDSVHVTGNISPSKLPARQLENGDLTFEYTTQGGRDSRRDDITPHWGGARITSGGTACSSGFIVQDAGGTRYALTAGHCGEAGSTWKSGNHSFGTMTNRASFPTRDFALLGGSIYGTYIWMGDSDGIGMMTGAAKDPARGTAYCISGTTTNENCNKRVFSLAGSFCDQSGCTSGLAAYQGGKPSQGGDSGGPLVLKNNTTGRVYPRGIHIAGAGNVGYAERWSTISRYFNVTAVIS